MPAEKTSHIVRLQDGSIDYRYYSAKGLIAKNREMKIVCKQDSKRIKNNDRYIAGFFYSHIVAPGALID